MRQVVISAEVCVAAQIKYIADPGMHSIPAVAVHPNKQWFVGTSLDNQIVTYAARDRFRQNRKKVFKVRLWAPVSRKPSWACTWCGGPVSVAQRLPVQADCDRCCARSSYWNAWEGLQCAP